MNAERNELLIIGDSLVLSNLIPLLKESDISAFFTAVLCEDSCPPDDVLTPEAGTDSLGMIRVIRNQGINEWKKTIEPFPFVVFASASLDLLTYGKILQACLDGGKVLLPASMINGLGILGPMTTGQADACLESAWRRLHMQTTHREPDAAPSPFLTSIYSNVLIHSIDLYLTTQTTNLQNHIYVFNETASEGKRYPLFSHPLAGNPPPAPVWSLLNEEILRQEREEMDEEQLYFFFDRLTSAQTGIIYELDEGDLRQLPLSLCGVKTADPLSAGPVEGLPVQICAGFNHLEARREAGLSGLQIYAASLAGQLYPFEEKQTCIGIGTTTSEAIGRAFQTFLQAQVESHYEQCKPDLFPLQIEEIKDKRCAYYLKSLNLLGEKWELFRSDGLFPSCPVIWLCCGETWYYACDLNLTFGVRRVLLKVLQELQTGGAQLADTSRGDVASIRFEPEWKDLKQAQTIVNIPETNRFYQPEDLEAILQNSGPFGIEAAEIVVDPALKELAVFGIRVKGGQLDEG